MLSDNSISHLLELRKRLLHCLLAFTTAFLIFFYFSQSIFQFFTKPLTTQLINNNTLIATDITAPLFIPLKLCLFLALFFIVPYILYQLWCFITPALYRKEKIATWPLLASSILLFYLGIAFAYAIAFPLMFKFFTHVAPSYIAVMPDISSFLDFSMRLFIAFGISFEVPVIIWTLVQTGVCTTQKLRAIRPYIIVGAFTIGMLLTPPDVLSQLLLAIPLCILFELGIFSCRLKGASTNSKR